MRITKYTYPTPLDIVVLSDLHNRPYKEIIGLVKRLDPDIIAIPGDVIYGYSSVDMTRLDIKQGGSEDAALISRYDNTNDRSFAERQENVLPFFKECTAIAPTFFSYGNHESMLCSEDIQYIMKTGVTILDNTFVKYRGVTIGGLTSGYRTSYLELKEKTDYAGVKQLANVPETDWLEDFERQNGFKLLLSHHPEYWEKYLKDYKIDLILSGHCHGGQIRIFNHGLFAPGQGWWPKYTKGIYDNMIISAGLANTGGIVPRLFNPREIVYISSKHDFVKAKRSQETIFFGQRCAAFECLSSEK